MVARGQWRKGNGGVMSTTELAVARQGRERRYRLGVMGGTFDPIHHGHLVAASEVAAKFSLDEVVFVPTGVPWQKTHRNVTQAEDRYLMTVIATASNPGLSVSRVDIDRPGNTYTVDTLWICFSSPGRMRCGRSSRGVARNSCSIWLTSSG